MISHSSDPYHVKPQITSAHSSAICILTCILQYVLRFGGHSETDLDAENSIITKQVLKRDRTLV